LCNRSFRPQVEELPDRCLPSAGGLGHATLMPALYDGNTFNINFKEQSAQAEQSLIANNGSINKIYMFRGDQQLPVLDAIQGDGFNPLWREVDVTIGGPNGTIDPSLLTSDTAILDAAKAGLVTLNTTNEVYRCSVVGPK